MAHGAHAPLAPNGALMAQCSLSPSAAVAYAAAELGFISIGVRSFNGSATGIGGWA